jgi:hypothetical protein
MANGDFIIAACFSPHQIVVGHPNIEEIVDWPWETMEELKVKWEIW